MWKMGAVEISFIINAIHRTNGHNKRQETWQGKKFPVDGIYNRYTLEREPPQQQKETAFYLRLAHVYNKHTREPSFIQKLINATV